MENDPRQAVPILAAVKLSKRSPPFELIIDGCQNMDRLVDAADLGHGLRQLGRAVANPESPHNRSRLNQAVFQRSSQSKHVIPMLQNQIGVDPMP